jgi:hypothetical protein
MKQLVNKFLCISLLVLGSASLKADESSAESVRASSVFVPRSTGNNLVRNQVSGYEFSNDSFYGVFGVDFEFQQSFKNERIGRALFGELYGSSNDTDGIRFVGSQVVDRPTSNVLMADNFGLSPLLDATLQLKPRVRNYTVDFQLYLALNDLWEGLYLQINAPLTHSTWDLRLKNENTTLHATPFAPGYMGTVANGEVAAATTFKEALGGTFQFGQMATNLKYGKIATGRHESLKLASFNFNLGYNVYECPDYHFGVYLKVEAPTGTELNAHHAEHLFKPVIGSHQWQLGAGLNAQADLWSRDDEQFLSVALEGYAAHAFAEHQVRSFDFVGKGALSRYMLLKQFNTDGTYANALVSGVNYSTRKARVNVDVIGEGMLKFNYTYRNFGVDLGYNIWGRSEENVHLKEVADSSLASTKFGFKGTSSVEYQGYTLNTPNTTLASVTTAAATGVPSVATQSTATISAGAAIDNSTATTGIYAVGANGILIDSAAMSGVTNNAQVVNDEYAVGTSMTQINATTPVTTTYVVATAAKTISDSDIDVASARASSQMSHKVFGSLNYTWNDTEFSPRIGLTAEVELASESKAHSLNQWGVGINASLNF